MINQRDHIEYVPHSRPKKFVLVLPQLRQSVKPDTYQERFYFPKRTILDVLWADKSASQRDALGVGLYFVLYAMGF